MKKVCNILIYLIIGNATSYAQKAGSLDLSFSNDAFVTITSPNGITGSEISLQSDGKIIVGGIRTYNAIGTPLPTFTITDFILLRYNTNGTLDSSFGVNGKVVTQISMASGIVSTLTDIIIQDDGKILISGLYLATQSISIRFNANGTKDTNFATNGSFYCNFGYFRNLLIQEDGKIIAFGSNQFGNADFLVIRLTSSGILDFSFDDDGVVLIDFGNIENGFSCVLQSDGKILIAGSTGSDFAVSRLLPNGSFDNTFNITGKLSFAIGSLAECPSILVQSDGKILIGGSAIMTNNSTLRDFTLIRINPDGSFDSSFDGDGKLIIHHSQTNTIHKLFLQSDGKIIAIGNTGHPNSQQCLFRCNQDGSIDLSFGNNGFVTTLLTSGGCQLFSGAKQKDGKIVTVGFGYSSETNYMSIVRYHGVSNFNSNDGKMITQIGFSNDRSNAVKLLKNGKILSGGYTYNGTDKDFALVMYKSNGEPDYSFGNNKSFITTNISLNSNDEINGITLQNDGKIIVVGTSISNAGNSNFVVARYCADGVLDSTFGNGGYVVDDFSFNSQDKSYSLFLQNDGKIVIIGSTQIGLNTNFALLRYTKNGNLDSSFGISGKVNNNFNSTTNIAKSIYIKSDGKIIVSGESGSNITVAQYLSNGLLDVTFGVNGYNIATLNSSIEVVSEMSFQNDGRILISGTTNINGGNDFFVFCYNFNGFFDNSFGINGKIFIDFLSNDYSASLSVYPSGKLILMGTINNNTKIGVCRLNRNGILDNGFGKGGKKIIDIGYSYDIGKSAAIQEDGKVLISGYYQNGDNEDFLLLRINEVNNFSVNNGKISSSLDFNNNEFNDILEQTDGKILLGGYMNKVSNNTAKSNKSFALARYNDTGILDLTFNSTGIINTFFNELEDHCTAIAMQSDNKIISVGNTKNNLGNFDFALVRHLNNGSIDLSFGTNGRVITQFANGDDICNAVAIQNDGKILVSGFTTNTIGNTDIAIARYSSTGNLDISFGLNGKITTDIQSENEFSHSIMLQSDGKIVVGGYTISAGKSDFVVVRYTISGILDQGFGNGGIVKISMSNSNDLGKSVSIQSDGKILIGGTSYSGINNDIALARLNTNGSLDNNFNGNGKLTLSFNNHKEYLKKLKILPSGKILILGQTLVGSYDKILLIRLDQNGVLDNDFEDDGVLEKNMSSEYNYANGIIYNQTSNSIIISGSYFNGSNLDSMLMKILSCDFETPILLNPFHNYPNNLLINSQIGKNISASNFLLNLSSVNYNAKNFIDFKVGLKAENVSFFNSEVIGCKY